MIDQVSANTVVELHELCLDLCPFPSGDRASACPECPIMPLARDRRWRVYLPEALKLVRAWADHVERRMA